MGDAGAWLVAISGTDTGRIVAVLLALLSAVSHAVFGSLQKGKIDPWLTRGAIDFSYGLIALPFVLFVVPWPEPHMWLIFAVVLIIHTLYKILQATAHSKGAFTVVYPIVRGMGAFVTIVVAGIVFNEDFTFAQWFGFGVLCLGIFGLAAYNYYYTAGDKSGIIIAIIMALLTGLSVAAYTTYDAYGIRSTFNPFTFLAWFFLIDGILIPIIAWRRWQKMDEHPPISSLAKRGLIGGLIAYVSFGSVLIVTRIGEVGEAAVLRETSTVFAALIGWLFLNETVGWRRAILIAFVAIGATIVEIGR